MGRTFLTRMALLHPIVFLGLLIVVFGAQGILIASEPDVAAVTPIILAGVLIPLLWAHGIYVVASVKSKRAGWRAAAFPVTELGLVIAFVSLLFAGPEQSPTIAAVGGFLAPLYFICFWLSAAALVRTEDSGVARLAPTLGTFLLMIYWFIGAWFIRPRVKRIAADI